MTKQDALNLIEDDKDFAAESLVTAIKDHTYFKESIANMMDLLKAHRQLFIEDGYIEMAMQCSDVINKKHNIDAVNNLIMHECNEFLDYIDLSDDKKKKALFLFSKKLKNRGDRENESRTGN